MKLIKKYITMPIKSERQQKKVYTTRPGSLKKIKREIDSLIGLDNVKKLIKEIEAFVHIQKKRRENNLVSQPISLHMVFKGNPGTGKTTIARLLAALFKELGVLEKGHLVEVERADLVGEYIGHTAQKVRVQINNAMGGILFIDEAYSLARGGERDFGKEAIDSLVKAMEDYKDSFILILAGYPNEMDYFLNTNPGLNSRFPIHMYFEDYTVEELAQIADVILTNRQYKLSGDARETLKRILRSSISESGSLEGNARFIRNMMEKAIRKQALRLSGNQILNREKLITIEKKDIIQAFYV